MDKPANYVVGAPAVLVFENGVIYERVLAVSVLKSGETRVITGTLSGTSQVLGLGKALSIRAPTDYERGTYY